MPQGNIQLEAPSGEALARVQEQLGGYDFVFAGHPPLRQQVPKGLLLNHAVTPSGRHAV